MKQSPYLQQVQRNMRPGVITRDGFLGTDRRNLIDILIEDDAAVKRMNLTHVEIAKKMRQLRNEGMKGLGEYIRVALCFEVRTDSVRGKLPCPFGHPGIIGKNNTFVRNLNTGREIIYTDLNIHMIEAHGFYEGLGAPFRLNPRDLVEILEITPA